MDQLLFFARSQYCDVSIFIAEIDFPICDQWGAPNGRERIIGPVMLAGFGIQAVQKSAQVGYIKEAVLDSHRGYGAIKIGISKMPDHRTVGYVAFQGRIDDPQMASPLSVLRILTNSDINLVIINDRGGNEIISRPPAAQDPN